MRAVLDPNVLISAAISPAGPPRQILTAWTNERFELIISPAVLDELADVLARPKFRRFLTTAIAVAFVDGLAADAITVTDPPDPPSVSPDPDDDYLIALARAARAEYIVSGDRHLLDLTDPNPPVLTPARSARGTGRLVGLPSTSTRRSPTPSSAICCSPRTRRSRARRGSSCSSRPRLWRSLGHHDGAGHFRIDGVTGPDEYGPIADNNVYTNLMAARTSKPRPTQSSATRSSRGRSRSTTRRPPAGATRRTRYSSPTTRRSASTRRPRGLPSTKSGTSTRPRRKVTRCFCTTRTSTSIASRSSNRPT